MPNATTWWCIACAPGIGPTVADDDPGADTLAITRSRRPSFSRRPGLAAWNDNDEVRCCRYWNDLTETGIADALGISQGLSP